MNELVFRIDWRYFLGIMGGLILLAWRTNGRFTALETSMTWVREIVSTIWKKRASEGVGEPGSPYQPTEQGDKMLYGTGMDKIINARWPQIEALIKAEKDAGRDTALDIERVALSYLEKAVYEEDFKPIREYVSENPVHGIDVFALIGSWYVRGKYREEEWLNKKTTL